VSRRDVPDSGPLWKTMIESGDDGSVMREMRQVDFRSRLRYISEVLDVSIICNLFFASTEA